MSGWYWNWNRHIAQYTDDGGIVTTIGLVQMSKENGCIFTNTIELSSMWPGMWTFMHIKCLVIVEFIVVYIYFTLWHICIYFRWYTTWWYSSNCYYSTKLCIFYLSIHTTRNHSHLYYSMFHFYHSIQKKKVSSLYILCVNIVFRLYSYINPVAKNISRKWIKQVHCSNVGMAMTEKDRNKFISAFL